jgi:cyclopropane-fatty-acyl-phospholipid synthase
MVRLLLGEKHHSMRELFSTQGPPSSSAVPTRRKLERRPLGSRNDGATPRLRESLGHGFLALCGSKAAHTWLGRKVRFGHLVLIDADGQRHSFGRPRGPSVTVRLRDHGTHLRVLVDPGTAFFEAYANGSLTVEEGGLHDFVLLCSKNFGTSGSARLRRLRERLERSLSSTNGAHDDTRSTRHLSQPELPERFFKLFLDESMEYSAGYFVDPHDSLKDAQENKRRHISAKLRLEAGQEVLEIGSGWGGLSISLATHFGVQVLGLTSSRTQLDQSRRRVREAGLSHRVRFELSDYRDIRGRFDRVVAIGTCGAPRTPSPGVVLRQIRNLLTEDGIALVEGLGRMDPPPPSSLLRDRVLPRVCPPSLSELLAAVERERLWCMDVEILRFHYAATHRHWRQRFEERQDEAERLYGEAFCRMWQLYLRASEIGFREDRGLVFQLQLSRRRDTVPTTRDYMFEEERGLEIAPPAHPFKQRLRLLDGPISR